MTRLPSRVPSPIRRTFTARLLALATAWWIVVAPSAHAMDRKPFDPARDLPGYVEADRSEYKDLFPLSKYADLLAKSMDEAELAATQAQWREEASAVQKHLDELRTNPPAGQRWLVEARMARHPYFSKVTLTADASVPGFLVYVQRPSFDDPQYAPTVVATFAPFLTKISQVFEARVVRPARATRRVDRPLTVIVVLPSEGDYGNYVDRAKMHDSYTSGAVRDEAIDAVVSFVNSFEKPKATTENVYRVLRETFVSLLIAHVKPPAVGVTSLWLREGLASAWAWPSTPKVESLDSPGLRADVVASLVETCHDDRARQTYLMPVSELCAVTGWVPLTMRLFGDRQQPPETYSKLAATFVRQSSAWMHYLTSGRGGRHRVAFEKYLELAMSGMSGNDALSLAFAGTSLTDLDRDFWAWVYDSHQQAFPDVAIDRGDLQHLFEKVDTSKAVDEIVQRAKASLQESGATNAAAEPPFAPSTLAIGERDVESRHGLALLQARRGDLEGAREALKALAATSPAAPEAGRVERDLARIGAAIRLRDALLAGLIAKGQRLAIEVAGKKINAPVARVENGEIVFGENAQGVKSLPLSSLDLVDVARLADKKELQGDAPTWTRAWIWLLAGDARFDKALKADSDEARELRVDASGWYRDRLRAGQAATIVESLAKGTLPTARAEAESVVARITDLMANHGTTSCVLLKKPALGRLARVAVDVLAADVDLSATLEGKFARDDQGVVTLTYEFDRPEERRDFVLNAGHLESWRKDWVKLKLTEAQSTLDVSKGALRVRGAAMWRLPFSFAAPVRIEADFAYVKEIGSLHPAPLIAIHLCDDGKTDYVHVDGLGNVNVMDTKNNLVGSAKSSMGSYFFGRTYKLVIVHDGQQVTVSVDGEQVSKGDVSTMKSGGVELVAHTETEVTIHRFVVQGTVDPESMAASRRAWADSRWTAIGF